MPYSSDLPRYSQDDMYSLPARCLVAVLNMTCGCDPMACHEILTLVFDHDILGSSQFCNWLMVTKLVWWPYQSQQPAADANNQAATLLLLQSHASLDAHAMP